MNLEGVELLIQLLDKNYFDERIFNEYISLHQTKVFIKHERELKRNTSNLILKNELKNVILKENYKDPYDFYLLKKNLSLLKKDIEYIRTNQDNIINNALERVYKVLPKKVVVNPKIYLIAGGQDGGFTIFMKNVYVNLGRYIGNMEEFEKVLAHELYHGRKLEWYKKFYLTLKMSMDNEKTMFETLGRIFEEGIACLIQHGVKLSKDDPIETLTRRKLILSQEAFGDLDKVLLSIKNGKPNYQLIASLDVYVLGYKIIRILYENRGVYILDEWTINYNYKRLIKEYVFICKEKNIRTGFGEEVDKWLLTI